MLQNEAMTEIPKFLRRHPTAPTSWAAEVGGMLLAPEDEAEAVETWEIGEYVLGVVVIIHRGYTTTEAAL